MDKLTTKSIASNNHKQIVIKDFSKFARFNSSFKLAFDGYKYYGDNKIRVYKIIFHCSGEIDILNNVFEGIKCNSMINGHHNGESIYSMSNYNFLSIGMYMNHHYNRIYNIASNHYTKNTKTQLEGERKMQNNDYVKYLNPHYMRTQIIDGVVNHTISYTKNKFGVEINIRPYEESNFLIWLKRYDKNYKNHISNPQELFKSKIDKSRIFSINDKNFYIKIDKATFAHITVKPLNDGMKDFKIFIFGKYCYKHFKILVKVLQQKSSNTKYIYKVSARDGKDGNSMVVNSMDLDSRNINTLFFDTDVKTTISDHIDSFFTNINIYHERNLTFKTGVLLYGEPGTGKSSLVKALATKYNLDVVSVDMNTFDNLNVDELVQVLNNDTETYIVLLEDIDTLIKSREDNIDKDDSKNINKLLQFLDSNTSPDSVIFIATTNHIDKLDSALTRDGRFDIKVKVSPLNIKSNKIKDMCKSFNLSDDIIEEIYDSIKDRTHINQSELQNIILKYVTNKNTSDED